MLFRSYNANYAGLYTKAAKWDAIQARLDVVAAAAPAGCGKPMDSETTVYIDLEDGSLPGPVPVPTLMPKQISAYGCSFKGQFVTTGDLYMKGPGGINKTILPPPGSWLPTSATVDVNFEGLVVVGGDMYWNSSPLIYGSLVIEGAYDSTGTIIVYYNYYFPYDGIAGGTFAITAWRELDPLVPFQTPTPIP